jgi:O-acetyl-ADP-ribose deacetylase (regulator of RNase III)
MDVLLVRSTVFALPSQRRVGAIVHDGASDLRLWPGRGPDSDLREAWGDGLQAALDAERDRLGGDPVPLGQPVRVHAGRLHCDFLLWLPTRGPEPGTVRQPAPDGETLEQAVSAALAFAAARDVERIAFPALGGGPGELDRRERLERIVRASHRYVERCGAEGRPLELEQVLVCDPNAALVREVQGQMRAIIREVLDPTGARTEEGARGARGAAGERKAARPGARRGSGRKRRLDEAALAHGRVAAQPYDMRRVYGTGDWIAHARFGLGRVEQVTPEGAIIVLFEGGEERKMVHAR